MPRSEPVERALLSLLSALVDDDRDALASLLAGTVEVIGTGEDQWRWPGRPDAFGPGAASSIRPVDPEGWAAGELGWVSSRLDITTAGGRTVRTRLTGVLRREGDRWRFVQLHHSLAASPDEAATENQRQAGLPSRRGIRRRLVPRPRTTWQPGDSLR